MVNSKQKGSQFERLRCKDLSLWVSGGERDDVFWRSALSGGRATLALRKSNVGEHSQAGDISYVEGTGKILLSKFVIECKHYRDLEVGNVLFGQTTGHFIKFWQELRTLATTVQRNPLLICKQNQRPIIAVTNQKGMDVFKGWELPLPEKIGYHIAYIASQGFHILDYQTLLEETSPSWRYPEEEQ